MCASHTRMLVVAFWRQKTRHSNTFLSTYWIVRGVKHVAYCPHDDAVWMRVWWCIVRMMNHSRLGVLWHSSLMRWGDVIIIITAYVYRRCHCDCFAPSLNLLGVGGFSGSSAWMCFWCGVFLGTSTWIQAVPPHIKYAHKCVINTIRSGCNCMLRNIFVRICANMLHVINGTRNLLWLRCCAT